ncbi:MAG TPA: putative Ig domain-containing protein, partial [Terriglobales bacterium]|nr:putative Ig domain-containing protein [Terriglobales bacterium]
MLLFAVILFLISSFVSGFAQAPPQIDVVSPTAGVAGTQVTIAGTGFGATQGSGNVWLGSTYGTVVSWSDTQVVATVASGAKSGVAQVLQGGVWSNSVNFTVGGASPVLQLGVDNTPVTVNLTSSPTLDWVVWGADGTTTAATRKAGTPIISDFSPVNTANVYGDTYGDILYSWNNGTPIVTGTGIGAEVSTWDLNGGFQITVPADTTVKTLKLYAGFKNSAELDISISDGSSPSVNTPLSAASASPYVEQMYSIDFRAASDGQTLTIRLLSTDPNGGVWLQAAALQPRLPQVTILSPQNGQVVSYPANLSLSVSATQIDVPITGVQVSGTGSQMPSLQSPPYTWSWSPVPGHYVLQGQATDGAGLTGVSHTVEADVIGSGGTLASFASSSFPYPTDLTSEGSADWILFAPRETWDLPNGQYYSGTVRKAGVGQLISAYNPLGRVAFSGCGGAQFSFEDGIPDPQEDAVSCFATSSSAIGSGFEFTVAADTAPRTLNVYVGANNAQGKLVAFLSDGSAPVIVDESLQSTFYADFRYTINFNAASAGQRLTVRWVMDQAFSPVSFYGNLRLYAATLTGAPAQTPLEIASVQPAGGVIGTVITITGAGFGASPGSVTIGGVPMNIGSWSDSRIVATVARGTATGILTVQQGSNVATGPTFTVLPPVVVTTTSLPNWAENASYDTTLTASGGQSPYFWSITAGSLPAGLSFNASTGEITGTPTATGTNSFTVQVTDSSSPPSSATQSLSLTINPPLAITTGSLPNGTQNVAYSAVLTAAGGVSPYFWSISPGALPAGLTLNPITGTLSGTPIGPGTRSFTVYVYDANASMAAMPLSLTIQPPSQTAQLTDSLGNQSTYTAAVIGGKWYVSDGSGPGCSSCTTRGAVHLTFDDNGNVLSLTDALGHTTSYTYDTASNMTSQTVQVDATTTATTTYTYNNFGEVLTITDPLGNTTTNTYDSHGNLLSVTSPAPDGGTAPSVTQFAYDSKGELTQITDPLGRLTVLTYTSAGLASTITDPQQNVTSYEYDPHGNRAAVVDAMQHRTTFAYDAGDRLVSITYPDQTSVSFTYDSRGRRTSATDQNGKNTTYAYDGADRLIAVTDA